MELTAKLLAIKAGKSLKLVQQILAESLREAKALGQENNLPFIKRTAEILLEIDNVYMPQTTKRILEAFLKSKAENFDLFLEEIMSTDFSKDDIPEYNLTNLPAQPHNHKYVSDIQDLFDDEEETENEIENEIKLKGNK